ncbi:MAG: hypothetical protein HYU78_07140 [Rhodocyclales bacterium]|nr:hypothetical protein [Rhodocyclales bacterium]
MADYARPGPFAVAVEDGEWRDPARDRRIAWRRYRPQAAGGPSVTRAPLVLHSHGLGGSRASGAGWLAHWASWGIAALAVQHPGSDASALPSDSPLALRHLLRSAVDAAQLAARQHDLCFALDRLTADAPPAMGVSGHSFGAVSALRLIGERRGRDHASSASPGIHAGVSETKTPAGRAPRARSVSWEAPDLQVGELHDLPADPRLAAAILFSPSARGGTLPLAERFAGVTVPCLHLTGSRDDGIGPGDIRAADRCLPFAHMPPPHQHLLVLDGATHPEFAGEFVGDSPGRHVRLLQAASTAFWLCHLFADAEAGAWLRNGLPQLLESGDRLLQK